jgi:hypothetical protein
MPFVSKGAEDEIQFGQEVNVEKLSSSEIIWAKLSKLGISHGTCTASWIITSMLCDNQNVL